MDDAVTGGRREGNKDMGLGQACDYEDIYGWVQRALGEWKGVQCAVMLYETADQGVYCEIGTDE